MENNKAYLKKFGPAFLIVVLGAIVFQVAMRMIFNTQSYSSVSKNWIYVLYAIPMLVNFTALGLITSKWIASASAFATHVVLTVVTYFIEEDMRASGFYFSVIQVIFLLPFITFYGVAGIPARKMPAVLAIALILQLGDGPIYYAGNGIDLIQSALRFKLNISEDIYNVLAFIISTMVGLIAVCELLNFGAGKAKERNTRLLNPGNEYSKLHGTILFWVLKSAIWFGFLGCIGYLRTLYFYSGNDYGTAGKDYIVQLFLTLFFAFFSMLATAWYLRKFVLEFFASYNLTSRFLYWFLLLPGIGFIAWLIMIADKTRQTSFQERERSIKEFSASKPDGITAVILIFFALRLLYAVTQHLPAGFFITLIASLGLFIWFTKDRTGYYFNLFLTIGLFFLFLVLLFTSKVENITYYVVYPLLLLNAVQIFLNYPAYHFDQFNYLSYEEEKPWEPGQDLFD